MEDTVFIVIWRTQSNSTWYAEGKGVFSERRLAENYIECAKAVGSTLNYAIVEGPLTNPAQLAQAEQTVEVI
jgi:hypothetical protein